MTGTPPSAAVDLQALKSRLKSTWMSGDYTTFAQTLLPGAMLFLEKVQPQSSERLLDVGCGAGQITIPAARQGALAVGVDIASNLIRDARKRAQDEQVDVRFEEGDAEDLQFADDSFDVVTSLYGAIFAPRPELVASELLRVCRSGGRIVMGNWTPDSLVGQMFRTLARHVPPAPMPSPMLWGQEDTVRERFGERVRELHFERLEHPFEYPFAPEEVVEHFRAYYGPTNRAFASLDGPQHQALKGDLSALLSQHNQAQDGTTRLTSTLLVVRAVKA